MHVDVCMCVYVCMLYIYIYIYFSYAPEAAPGPLGCQYHIYKYQTLNIIITYP